MKLKTAFFFVLVLFSLLPAADHGWVAAKKDFILIAHRGGVVDENRSENSLAALEEAISRGYTHVEVDARCTKDGRVVCFHLADMKSETGLDAKISDLTLEEVKQVTLLKSKEHIPTFDEYCSRCKGRIGLMVDIKGVPDQWLEDYTKEIEATLIKYGILENTLFLINRFPVGNQEKVAAWFLGRSHISWRQNVQRTLLLKPYMPDISKYYYIFNSPVDYTLEDIRGFHKMGLKVIASINYDHYRKTGNAKTQGPADVQKMLEWGVDGLQIDSCYDPTVLEWLHKK
jgi:glycerophosphoryl diester phosphodiesterase